MSAIPPMAAETVVSDPELERFEQLCRLADKLIADASKDDVAEAARILALDLAQCRARYGELPAAEYVSLPAVDSLTPELAKTLADGASFISRFTLSGRYVKLIS